jgi:hypothetical protein
MSIPTNVSSDPSASKGAVQVEFIDSGSNRETIFYVGLHQTLGHAWKEAYRELKEKPKEGDELLCREGDVSLMEYLELTFEKLAEKKICPARRYKIRRGTGGA